MSETSLSLEKKEKNWITRILKLTFILLAFLLVGITVLANMGGSNDSLKSSVEKFVSDMVQGRPTKVDELIYMSFFPRLGFDANGINILSSLENGYKIVEIGKVQVFMKFWDVAFRRPFIKQFYIQDFKAIEGAMGPKEIYIEKIFIDHDIESGKANLKGNGKIGKDDNWSFELSIGILGSKGDYKYKFESSAPFLLNISDISVKGIFISHEDGYIKFKDLELVYGDINLKSNITLSALGKKMLKLKGDVMLNDGGASISPDLIFDHSRSPVKVDGVISSKGDVNNIAGEKAILDVLKRFREIIGYEISINGDDNGFKWSDLFDFNDVKLLNNQVQEQ